MSDRDALFAALAARRGLTGGARPIGRRDGTGPVPLLPAQRHLLLLDRLGADAGVYTVVQSWRLRGPLDTDLLRRALDRVVDRHEALRAGFAEIDGEPAQVIAPAGSVPVGVEIVDVSDRPAGSREAAARQQLAAAHARPFDLAAPPLLRAFVARLDHEDHVFALLVHHIVADAPSLGIVLTELGECYGALRAGETPRLPEPSAQFGDYAVWQHRQQTPEALAEGERYWTTTLGGAPRLLTLPTDRPRPGAQSYRGAGHPFTLPPATAAAVADLARRTEVTPFTVLLTAFGVLLARYSGQDDVVIGAPMRDESVPQVGGCVGMFANTVALRIRTDGDPTVAGLLHRVQRESVGALDHQRHPWDRVVRAVAPTGNLSHNPVFQVMFVHNAAGDGFRLPGVDAAWLERPVTTSRFDLTLALAVTGDGIEGQLDFATDLFDPATIRRLAGHLEAALTGLLDAGPHGRVAAIEVLTGEDRRLLGTGGHPAPVTARQPPMVPQRIVDQAGRTPSAVAVADENGSLTYAQLLGRAGGLAWRLREHGVGPEVVVAVALPTGIEAVVAVLGVLLAGGAYLPLDPDQPPARLGVLLDDARPRVVLTDPAHRPLFPATTVLTTDAGLAAAPPPLETGPDHLAYVIHTSGSTGTPKGVAVPHGTLARLVDDFVVRHGFGPGQRVLMVPPLTFDASVGDVFPALAAGAAVVPCADPAALTGPDLIARCRAEGITMIDTAAALWRRWTADLADAGVRLDDCPVRTLMVGGDLVPAAAVRQWARITAGTVELHNHYGPTEATVCATSHRTRDAAGLPAGAVLPIGGPLPHVRAYVVDGRLRPVPLGVPGELCLGGDAPARGYLGRPAETAQRFVPDPFHDRPGARMYRTGDVARWRADGTLEFLGRVDRQLKVRGHRIEPAEVEGACRTHPSVRDAAVIAAPGPDGVARLVCYVLGADGVAPDTARVRAHLRTTLPAHLVPDTIQVLDRLPVGAHGKVDVAALPPVDWDAAGRQYLEPEDPLARRVARVWARLLGQDRVGATDDFFALGGHSLLAGTLVNRIRAEFGAEVPVRAVFEASVLTDFAREVAARLGPDRGAGDETDVPALMADAALPPDLRTTLAAHPPGTAAARVARSADPGHVLLTGATGFLGSHLLADLLRTTGATVHCLVRADDDAAAAGRIVRTLTEHRLWRPEDEARIVPVVGDLAEPGLGLTRARSEALAGCVDVVYHCGGMADFLRPYSHLRAGNVLGVREVLRIAARRLVPVHLVSTLGVFPMDLTATVTEADPPPPPDRLHRGYERSKWVADALARSARAAGLPVSVHRPARITGDSRTGIGPAGDRFVDLLRTTVLIGSTPAGDEDEEDMAPVDYVAAAIGYLSRQPRHAGRDFHYFNPRTMRFSEVVRVLREAGYPLREVPYADWVAELRQLAAESTDAAVSAIGAVMRPEVTPRRTGFDCTSTRAAAAEGGIVCPPADEALLRRYLAHFVRVGQLPAVEVAR